MKHTFIYTLIIPVFLMPSICFGMKSESDYSWSFTPGKEILKKMGNVYEIEPKITDPLDEKHVLNDYWKNIKLLPDRKTKDFAFSQVLNINFKNEYALERFNIAAAILSGANPNIKDKYGQVVLTIPTQKGDYSLCKLLFEHGANPNIKSFQEIEPLLCTIKKFNLANLFVECKADTNVVDIIHDNLLGTSMRKEYESELVLLYKSKGVSPFYVNSSYGTTVLHRLAYEAKNYDNNHLSMFAKLSALLDGLSAVETLELINAPIRQEHPMCECAVKDYRKTLFDILGKTGNRSAAKALAQRLQEIVKKNKLEIECKIIETNRMLNLITRNAKNFTIQNLLLLKRT